MLLYARCISVSGNFLSTHVKHSYLITVTDPSTGTPTQLTWEYNSQLAEHESATFALNLVINK